MAHRADGPDEPSDAFEELFRREFGSICRTVFVIAGDWEVAREITQDAFVQVLRHWEKVRAMESPGGWTRRVAIRRAVRARSRAVRGRALVRLAATAPVGDADATDVDVHRAVLALPGRQRAAIVLRYFDDRSVAEIAALLGCSEGAVKTHLARGRRTLADRLGEEVTDEP